MSSGKKTDREIEPQAEETVSKSQMDPGDKDAVIASLKELRECEFVLECCHCGTEIEFETVRCPICGTRLGSPDSGIVEFIKDSDFEGIVDGPVCPDCGESILPDEDICSACGKRLHTTKGAEQAYMDPIIHTDKVVFLHLDVSTGEVDYLRRLENKQGFGQATVQISAFEKEGKSRRGVR